VHESVHSWYYGVLASNEGRYPWMDEGMTEYAGCEVMKELFQQEGDPHAGAYEGYKALVESGRHEPPSMHADHFRTNRGYGATAYSFGELFVDQLGAVVGERALEDGLRRYYEVCKFKHPEPVDLERVMEKESGLELDWYFDGWLNSTRTLDHAIRAAWGRDSSTSVELERRGEQLMPVDLLVDFVDGTSQRYHIPLSLQRGHMPEDGDEGSFVVLPSWQWTDPVYTVNVPVAIHRIRGLLLDPLQRTADIDRGNDQVVMPAGTTGFVRP
jgi:hypothetical protein